MPTADELRQQGNEAFKAKRYIAALQHYKDAVAIDPSNVALYNNCAAASHQLGNFEDAKRHARAGLKVEETAKGFVRLGAAQWALGEYVDAEASYGKALALAPDEASIKEALEEVRALARGGAVPPKPKPAPPATQSSAAPPPQPTAGSNGSYRASSTSPASASADPTAAMLDLAIVASSVIHFLTMLFSPGISMLMWKAALAARVGRQMVILRPAFRPTLEWAKTLPSAFAGQYLALSAALLLSGAPPLPLLMVAMCIYAALDLATAQRSFVDARIPPVLLSRLRPHIGTAAANQPLLLANAAMCEVVSGFMLPLAGAGAIAMVVHWQFLKFRYLSDVWSQRAFTATAQQAGKLFYHPRCPAIIGTLYTKLQSGLHRMATG